MITSNKKRHSVNKLSALSCPVLLAKLDKEIPRKHYKPLDISSLIAFISRLKPNSCFIVVKANQLHHLGCDGLVQLQFLNDIRNFSCIRHYFMKLSKKLKALRILNNCTQKEFAAIINITGRSYQGLEYGKHIPGGRVLQKLCNKFPQYALWLMTDIDDVASIKNQAIMEISKKLKALRTLNNDTQKEFAIMVNMAWQSYQRLEYGKHIPGGRVLQKLCNKFPQYALWLMTDIDDVANIKNQAIKQS